MSEPADDLFQQARQLDKDHTSLEEKQQAAALYQQAADLGNARAAFNLALMHNNGELGEPDKHIVAKLYQQAADLGQASAVFNLAVMYDSGELGEPDKHKAAKLYQQAADLGHANAAFNLALMYKKGELGEPDKHKAAKLYQQAADLGNAPAAFNLALMYDNGELGDPDKHKAAKLYQQAADLGNAPAAFNLALMYDNGELGDPDKHKAAKLYQQAADLGNAPAAFNLALMYHDGEFSEPDMQNAAMLFQQAAHLGHASAAFNLAHMYKRGALGKTDIFSANKWFSYADQLNHPHAYLYLPNKGITTLITKIRASDLKSNLEHALSRLNEVFINIRSEHLLGEETALSHFTGWKALESMLPVNAAGEATAYRNVLRQYHVDYMNDPKEGHRLLDFNKENEKATAASQILKALFEKEYQHYQRHCQNNHALLPSVFICSLTLDSDRLDLWRAYGNDGDGYCLTFDFDGSQQARSREVVLHRENQDVFYAADSADAKENPKQSKSANEHAPNITPPVLYKIRYADEDIISTLEKLHEPLIALQKLRAKLESDELREELDACIASMLLELLYLYKDEQYANEHEVRAVRMLPLNDSRIRSDERIPGRLYIETNPFLFTTNSSITVGPKVPGKDQLAALWNLRWRLTKHGFDKTSKVVLSQVAYR